MSKILKSRTLVMAIMLVLGTLVMAAPEGEEQEELLSDWPSEGEWINYTFRGERIRDWEDKPYETDPTHGPADVNPDAVDIASGVDACGGGEENNPGNYTSVQYLYKDINGDSDGFQFISDDWLFLRMRIAGDPRHGGKYAYKAYHWDILLEFDGDLWSEFVVDLNGGDGSYKFGTVGVYYNNTEDYEYDPDNDGVWQKEASKESNDYTRTVLIDYSNEDEDDDQWWIEYRIPVTAFTDYNGNQLLCADTNFMLFFSTSASLTNPLQKDWMGEYIFGEPANITVEKTAQEGIVAPGDTLHYTIYYNNTGDFNANDVWVSDTIPEYTTFLECAPPYDSVDGRTYEWHFTDIAPGNHSLYLNVTVDNDVPDGTILKNVVVLNYTDHNDDELPGSEDETENPVEGPVMVMTKETDRETADPGDIIEYTITYENTGSGGAYNVIIEDTIPEYTSFEYSIPGYTSVSGNTYTWVIDYVPGNSIDTIYIYVTVDAYTPDETVLVNHATLNYEDVNGNPYEGLEDWAYVTIHAPMMTLSKTADMSEANPGDQITYTITYENIGTGDATDIVIKDTIDPDTTYISATPTPDSILGDVLKWNIGTVIGGASGTITLIVEVDAYVGDEAVLTNSVILTFDDANGNQYPELTDSVDVTCTAPIMTIAKTADKSEANPGDQITYTISYENMGTGDAYNVVIEDTIDPDTTYISATPAPDSVMGDVITWNIGTVVGGASETITLIVEVDAYVEDGTVLSNSVVLNYEDSNGNPYSEESDSVEVTVTAPIMTITKTADLSEADPGDHITYTITYENTGTGDATDVVIVDTIDPDTSYLSATPAPDSVVGDVISWNIGTVAGGASGTITIIVEVDASVEDGTVLTNTVTLNFDDANGNPYSEESDSVEVTVTAPVMTITKTADVDEADPGDEITYTITYENTGTGDATDVVIVDTIDPDTSYLSATPAPDSVVDDVITWNIGTVAGGGSGTITLIVEVDAGVEDGTVLTNSVILNYDDANGNPYSEESDSVDVTVTAPFMTITKTADVSMADPGDQITYTISYENTATGDATDVVIKDTIDPDTSYFSATPSPNSVVGDVIKWNIGTVAGGGSGTITLIVEVDAYVEDGTVLTNSVTLNYDDANGNEYTEESDSVDVTVTAPVMSFSKSADATVADPGDTIVYTLYYENSGGGEATGVTVTDTIPEDTSFVDSDPDYDEVSDNTYTWDVGTVGAYSSGTITITVTVNAGVEDATILHNTATFDYDDANGNPYDQLTDYADVTVTAPVMSFTKTADSTEANPGDTIVYTLYYENSGGGEATGVTVKDTIPEDTTFVDSDPDYDEVSGNTYTWDIGTLGAYSSGTITITVTVNAGVDDGTLLRNTATFDYDDANGNPYDQLTDYADVTVTAPVMSFSKTADVTEADPGDTIIYTLTYENSGSGDATGVVIKDTIPEDTTFASSEPDYDDVSGDTYTWNIGTVAAFTIGTITITVTVNPGTADGTLLHNTATFDYNDVNGNPYDQLTDYADVTVTAPEMIFSKSADCTSADPGDTIIYILYYENTGSGMATGVTVTDTIPEDTTFVSSDPDYDGVSGDTYTWNVGTVGAYSSGTITITVTVDPGISDGTVLQNVATLDYDDANGNPYDQLTDYANVTVTAPVMSFSKTASVTSADPGDTIMYTLTYINSGSGVATDVVVTDTIPENTSFVGSDPDYDDVSGDTYTWNIGNVGAYSSGTITITVTVDPATPDGAVLRNTATLDYDDANGNPYDQITDYADVTVTAPVLSITKIADATEADPEDQITYTIEFENSGEGNATDVWINDTIPTYTTLVSTSPDYNDNAGDTYMWYYSLILSGEIITITIVVEVDVGTPDQTLLHNTVTLDYSDDNGNPLPQESAFADVSVTAPVLHVTKTADASTADPGDTIIYIIYYSNSGTGLATLVEIVDTIPAHTTFVDSNPAYDTVSGDEYTWNIGDVEPGTNGTITISVTVDVATPDETLLHNEVTLDYADANGNYYTQLEDYADVMVTAPVMTITKMVDVSTANPGDLIVYTITYKNIGTGWASLVRIVDTLPNQVTLVNSTPPYDSFSGNDYIWDLGDVAPGTTETIIIEVMVNVGTDDETLLHNTVTLDYADANGNYYPQQDDYADVIVTAPVMSLFKVADVSEADPGDTIIYTLDYENSGTGDASNVIIVDILPDDVTYVSASQAPDSIVGNNLTWNIGDMLAGTSGSITVTVTVNVGTSDEMLLINEVTLDYSDANGNFIEQLSDSAVVTVTAPIMTLSKDVGEITFFQYVLANFTIRIAGEKWHDVRLTLFYNGVGTEVASVTRFPGDPDDQSVTIYDVKIGVIPGSFTAAIVYTPYDDDINGQWWGADPCWLTITFPDGYSKRIHHTFNVRHNDTWIWTIDDFLPYITGQPIITEALIPYTITYENIGTGDATNVVITDTFPENLTISECDPPYDSCVGNAYTWNIGTVLAGEEGQILVNASYIFEANGTLLTNAVTLNYSDANGNFVEQLSAFADVVLTISEDEFITDGYIGGFSDEASNSDTFSEDVILKAPDYGSLSARSYYLESDDIADADETTTIYGGSNLFEDMKISLYADTDVEQELPIIPDFIVGEDTSTAIVTSEENDGVVAFDWLIVYSKYTDLYINPEQNEFIAALEEPKAETYTWTADVDSDGMSETVAVVEDEEKSIAALENGYYVVELPVENNIVYEEVHESENTEYQEPERTITAFEKPSSTDSEVKIQFSGLGKAFVETSAMKVTTSYFSVFAALLLVLSFVGAGIYTIIKKRR